MHPVQTRRVNKISHAAVVLPSLSQNTQIATEQAMATVVAITPKQTGATPLLHILH